MKSRHAKMIIIGSGPAGYTAGIYAARAMLKPLLIEGIQPGGQMTITTDVENYPGFADVIQGPWLMEQMQAQAEHVGTEFIMDHISKVDLARHPFRLVGAVQVKVAAQPVEVTPSVRPADALELDDGVSGQQGPELLTRDRNHHPVDKHRRPGFSHPR